MKTRLLTLASLPLLFFILAFMCPLQSAAQGGPAVAAFIDGPTYDQAKNAYKGTFNVSNGDEIAYLVYKVEDAEAGTERIADMKVNLAGFSSRPFEFSGAALEDGRKYKLMLQGVDQFGNIIEKSGENVSTQGDEKFYLAIKEFAHVLPKKAAFAFTINSVNADRDADELTFRLTVPGGFKVLKYDGYILDESNQQVATIREDLFPGPDLPTALPEAIAKATEEHKYKATLRLFTQDDQLAEQTYEFGVPAAVPPGLFERIGEALTKTPGDRAGDRRRALGGGDGGDRVRTTVAQAGRARPAAAARREHAGEGAVGAAGAAAHPGAAVAGGRGHREDTDHVPGHHRAQPGLHLPSEGPQRRPPPPRNHLRGRPSLPHGPQQHQRHLHQ